MTQQTIYENAIKKIDMEVKEFQGDRYGNAVHKPLAEALKTFCKNPEFAAKLLDSINTLSDCCKKILKGVKDSISDAELYRQAVKFYIPEAEVKFDMRIITPTDVDNPVETVADTAPSAKEKPECIISIFDIL